MKSKYLVIVSIILLVCAFSVNALRIDIEGDLNVTGDAIFNDDSTDDDFRIESNGQTHMFFVDAGNDRVGIGADVDPDYTLDVDAPNANVIANFQTGQNDYTRIIVNNQNNNANADAQLSFMKYGSTQWSIGNDASDNSFRIRTGAGLFGAGNDKFTITSAGKVGIGTTSPGSMLHAVSASANDALLVQDDSGTCEAQPTTTGLTWSCSSDINLKENVREASPYLDYITGIPLFDYTVKKTGETQMGWIAQEMLKYPQYADLVTNRTYHDIVAYNNESVFNSETNQMEEVSIPIYEEKSELSVSEISQPKIIKAMQELKAENDLLKTELCLKDNTYSWCG